MKKPRIDVRGFLIAGCGRLSISHYGLPFAAVRVISDPAHRALPELTMNAIKPNGNVDMWKVMRGIARNPKTIPHLISTGRDFSRALRSLKGCAGALG